MSTDFVVVSTSDTITVVSEGAMGPVGPQGIQGNPGNLTSVTSPSQDGEVVVFNGTLGSQVRKFTLSGVLKTTAGLLQVAEPNTDYIPPADPIFTGGASFALSTTKNILIDARTNPRQVTVGVFRVEHTAGIDSTRPITLDIRANGFGTTKAVSVDYVADNVTSGEGHLLEFNIDTSNSTGGDIQAFAVSKSGTGLANVSAVEVYSGVNVIHQKIGDPISLTQAWLLSVSTYTDATTAFDTGTNIAIFTLDNDYIICGLDAVFDQIEAYLQTSASLSITPIFSYSTGVGTWQTFSPADGTTGFTRNGSIAWNVDSLTGWVPSLVNGVSKYYIRIQRTTNNIGTIPIELSIRVTSTVNYGWDKDANISVHSITAAHILTYADRATAVAAGLTTGQFYQSSAGALMIV